MLDVENSVLDWARDEVFSAAFGHRTRNKRASMMLARMATNPRGTVLDVFETCAERQGAYDFLENSAVRPEALCQAIAEAAAARAREFDFAFVAVDGSSLTLTDRARAKDFGAIGSNDRGARGLKVISAYALSPSGLPHGVCAQVWWARVSRKKRGDHQRCKLQDKETQRWVDAIENTTATFDKVAERTRAWFQIDREGDGAHVLTALQGSGHWFTVRSSHNRRLVSTGGRRRYLRNAIANVRPCGEYRLNVAAAPNRKARSARMVVRILSTTLNVRDKVTGKTWPITVNVVSAREVGTTPRGEKPLCWTLLTNRPVVSFEDACLVIYGYSLRWRIEELHRTWKSGACNVERSQLRKKSHVIKWAALMTAVAARIERLKVLARTEPELPASVEMTVYEIRAAVLVRRRTKKRTDPMPTDNPTIGELVRWLADLGGYMGPKSSGGPAGSITIRRGLDKILPVAQALEQLEIESKLR